MQVRNLCPSVIAHPGIGFAGACEPPSRLPRLLLRVRVRSLAAAWKWTPALVVDGETIPPLGKTKLKPGSRVRIGRVDMAQGGAAVFEVQRVVHAHA